MIKIGILSDTHLYQVTPAFKHYAASCFSDVSMILHAGDLTSVGVLSVFEDKEVHAVHGNMCEFSANKLLPRKTTVQVGDFSIGLIHRAGRSYDFEDTLIDEFDGVDCVVYGHTHKPVSKMVGDVLMVNPGSFISTGRYGAPGTYAIMEVGSEMHCAIHEVS